MKKSSLSFHPLEVSFQYPHLIKNAYIKSIKKQLSYISIFLGRLIYTKNYNKKIKYDKEVLRRLKIKLTKKEENAFEEKKILADLLLVVKFIPYKTTIVNYELYTKNDEDDTADSRRTYIALLKVKNNYDLTDDYSKDMFTIYIIREILKILGFRKEFLKRTLYRLHF